MNPYAYGGNYVVNHATVTSRTNSAGGSGRRKSRHADNGDTASDIEMKPQRSAADDMHAISFKKSNMCSWIGICTWNI